MHLTSCRNFNPLLHQDTMITEGNVQGLLTQDFPHALCKSAGYPVSPAPSLPPLYESRAE